jgi:phage baseplate assembly protein W
MPTPTPKYDLRVPLALTSTGDLSVVTGLPALRQRLRHLIVTQAGELVHRPRWGASLTEAQCEPVDESLLARVRGRVRRALEGDRDVAEVLRVDATADTAALVELTVWVRASGGLLTYEGLRVTGTEGDV